MPKIYQGKDTLDHFLSHNMVIFEYEKHTIRYSRFLPTEVKHGLYRFSHRNTPDPLASNESSPLHRKLRSYKECTGQRFK